MKQYKYHLDVLRVVAAIAVVLIHVSDEIISHYATVAKSYWWMANIGDGIARFAVPVFFMITGALLLSSKAEDSVASFYIRRGKRVLIPYLVWAVFYVLFSNYIFETSFVLKDSVKQVIYFNSYYHMWFFQAIIAVYIFIPFIKPILQRATEKEIRNLVLIWFAFQIAIPLVSQEIGQVSPIPNYLSFSFLGYAILGYYIEQYRSKILLDMSGLFFILGTVMTIALTYIKLDKTTGALANYPYYPFSINIFLASVGIVGLVTKMCTEETKQHWMIKKISPLSFGIFLIHPLFLTLFKMYVEINPMIQQNIFGYIGTYIVVLGSSILATLAISRIPILKRSI
ncbi:acyltransferase [Priestia taiwanensis]|uniref:Acyltransferase 3 domain-containing protein n=1 Tax=Priestia taiwanensis TaxID=1347902 RepID=A0A917ESD7_9BACI|nr:acyltransferase family protein [Priestia taiwanensis]MBM7365207.1 surface polysaccharide O-acyltransferase-like enzyme [Priestia taiwanensis]GGE73680.1 hypothetical protein GCM10007140_24490 [Priestia taiwanensis]